MWEKDSSPRIVLEVLQKPINQGGLNLLDIYSNINYIPILPIKADLWQIMAISLIYC